MTYVLSRYVPTHNYCNEHWCSSILEEIQVIQELQKMESESVEMAKIAEQAERYEDMAKVSIRKV